MALKSIPKKCPKCGSLDISIYSYDPLKVGYISEAEVNCINCGVFGSVKVQVIPIRGTFEI